MRHPISSESLQSFAAGTSSREENRSILTHLLRGCASCADEVRSAFRPEIPADAYDAVFERVAGNVLPAQAAVLPFRRPAPVKAITADPGLRRARR
jgi:hypothetical protein